MVAPPARNWIEVLLAAVVAWTVAFLGARLWGTAAGPAAQTSALAVGGYAVVKLVVLFVRSARRTQEPQAVPPPDA